MQVICSCGKKLFFGDDPNEEQVCDRCGQKVRPSGPVQARGKDLPGGQARSPSRPGGPGGLGGTGRLSPLPRRGPEADDRLPGRIASEHRRSRLGCVLVPLALVAAAVGADWVLRPPGPLPCGHRGKMSYVFGLVPGHGCAGLDALRYLDRVRRTALAQAEELPRSFGELVRGRAGLEKPSVTPYVFELLEDGSLVADPLDETTGLFHYRMERSGIVRCEESERAGPSSLQTGSF